MNDIEGITLWNDEVFSYVPKQYNSKTVTGVAAEDEYYDELNKQFGMYVETHSHNSMSAFASGTDIEYSQNDGIQLVFGHLDKDTVQMHSWLTIRGVTREFLDTEELAVFLDEDICNLLSIGGDGKYYIPFAKLPPVTEDMIPEIDTWESRCLKRPALRSRRRIEVFDKEHPIEADYRQMGIHDLDKFLGSSIDEEEDNYNEDEMDEEYLMEEANPHFDRAVNALVTGLRILGYKFGDDRTESAALKVVDRAFKILRREEHKHKW